MIRTKKDREGACQKDLAPSLRMMNSFLVKVWLLAAALPVLGPSITAAASSSEPFYTCDELTPDLCELDVEEGQLEIKGINVTYWKYTAAAGDSASSSHNPKLSLWPIVALHGGPAFTHNYILPLKQQACRGRTIIFYDQAGCGKSPVPVQRNSIETDYPWLLDTMYYATVELPALLRHWKFNTKFHIVGSSWGTALAQLYALDAEDDTRSLASMVLSGPFSDSQAYIQAQWDDEEGNLGSLPPFLLERIRIVEAAHAYDSGEYQAIATALTGKFTLRTQPAPDCWIDAEEQANQEIYTKMQGFSEFTMSGVLADFNVTGRLHTLHDCPVLLTHGTYDTMRPSVVRAMSDALPYAETLLLEKSGHVSMIDEPQKMNDAMADFYDRVEEAATMSSSSTPILPGRHVAVETMITRRQSQLLAKDNQGTNTMQSASFSVPPVVFLVSMVMVLVAGVVMGDIRATRRMRSQYTHIIGETEVL